MTQPAGELPLAKNVLIRASAGTGKTYQLARRYVQLLEDVSPDRMLATTFTRKAAGEILERILQMLAAKPEPNEDDAARLARLREFTRRLHRVHIGTLDSFFINVGSAISLELGLPAGWRIIDEHEEAQLRLRAIEALLQTESTADVVRLMHLLSKGQARQGVTRQLLQAVERFHTLYLTTDADAWRRLPTPACLSTSELNAALDELGRAVVPELVKWKEAHGDAVQAAQANQWEEFLRKGIARSILDGRTKYRNGVIRPELVEVYQRLIRHGRAILIKQLAERNEATWELLQRYDAAWNEIAREERVQTFLHVTLRLANHFARHAADGASNSEQSAALDRIAFRIDSQIDQLLLDEFQDTSISQWNALSRLAVNVANERTGGLLCVGDEKQAIYGWRGGRSELFAQLEQRIDGLTPCVLNESRRSSQPVIDVVNEVFQSATRHPDLDSDERAAVAEFTAAFPEHTTMQPFAGYVELIAAEGVENQPPDAAVNERIVALVKSIQKRGPGCTIGILLRTNDDVGDLIHALRGQSVDASEEGGTPVTDSVAVQLILSALTLADHPGDLPSRFHVAQSPLAKAVGLTAFEDDRLACRVASDIRRRLIEHGYSRTLAEWRAALSDRCNSRELDRLQQLVELADNFQPMATLRTADFIRYVEKQRMDSPSRSAVRVMTIHQAKGLQFDVTILGELKTTLTPKNRPGFVCSEPNAFAKTDGMCLYVSEFYQSLLPTDVQHIFRATARREIREALCLLYVAMTRAARALYMVCPPPNSTRGKVPATYAGLLSAALAGRNLSPGEVIARGDADWFSSLPAKLLRPRPVPRVPLKSPIAFAPDTDGEARVRARVSPSRELTTGRMRLSRVLKPVEQGVLDRGTLIHAWLESIEWLDDGRPSRETLKRIAVEVGASESETSAAITQFQAMLSRPEILLALSRAGYAPPRSWLLPTDVMAELAAGPLRLELERERRFVVREGKGVVSGAIDRLVLMYRGENLLAADVIDFKSGTGTLDPAEAAARQEGYRRQLACYARAVAGIYQIEENRISTRLLMLGTGRVEAVQWNAVDSTQTIGLNLA